MKSGSAVISDDAVELDNELVSAELAASELDEELATDELASSELDEEVAIDELASPELDAELATDELNTAVLDVELATDELTTAALDAELATDELSTAALDEELGTDEITTAALDKELATDELDDALLDATIGALETAALDTGALDREILVAVELAGILEILELLDADVTIAALDPMEEGAADDKRTEENAALDAVELTSVWLLAELRGGFTVAELWLEKELELSSIGTPSAIKVSRR